MIFLCSGEGVSDLGACVNQLGVCDGDSYRFGPLLVVLDSIVEMVLQYSPLAVHPAAHRYYSEAALTQRLSEKKRERRGVILPGRKHGIDTGLFYLNARMLGEIALQLESELDDQVIAVLFRDSDGTNSSPRDIWERKTLSMIEGFKSANFHRGVPMVPRPKSEVWFLCAMKDNPYQHCASLENLPGNDSSPNSAKSMLSGVLEGEATADMLLRWLCENRISVQDIAEQMPSFSAFYQRFVEVLNDL